MLIASKLVLFSVSGLKDEKLIKKQTYMKTETCKLYSIVFWIFLPNIIKINHYNSELCRFKVGAFFETQCINWHRRTKDSYYTYSNKTMRWYSKKRCYWLRQNQHNLLILHVWSFGYLNISVTSCRCIHDTCNINQWMNKCRCPTASPEDRVPSQSPQNKASNSTQLHCRTRVLHHWYCITATALFHH